VVTSDLARAVETARIAFDGSGIPVVEDARLRECDYGELNGAPVDVVHAQRSARVDTPYPGGQSCRDVVAQVRSLLDELLRDQDGRRILLIGHAATRFALDHLLAARPLESAVVAPFAWRPGWEYALQHAPPTLEVLDDGAALHCVDELALVYRAAFGAPGYDEPEERIRAFATSTLPKHAARDGFRLAAIRESARLRGFAYGFTGGRGQWWTDEVLRTTRPEDRTAVADWLGGHFEVAELAVEPAEQRRGFGRSLVEALLRGLPHDRAVLTTYADDRPAPRLYAELGWQRLTAGVLNGSSDLWGVRLAS
jgi:ribosomal protein S18 acetylase RimI-like enzyme